MEQICTLYEFSQLSNYQKFGILEDHGTYLELYQVQGPVKICLFQLFNFYVEVHLDQVKDKIIKAVPLASSSRKLDQYLQEIDVSTLFEML